MPHHSADRSKDDSKAVPVPSSRDTPSSCGDSTDHSLYVHGSTGERADELHALRQQLGATQEALQREAHHVQLLEAELLRLRCSQTPCLYSRRWGASLPPSGGTSATASASAVSGQTASPPDAHSEGTGSDISGCDAQHLMMARPDAVSNGTFERSDVYMSSRCHSVDKAALYSDGWEHGHEPQLDSPGSSVTISREAFELLRLKDRAMDNTKEGITIADCSQPDMPLIYANEAFARITGYSVSESLGKNCRFLQGPGTDEAPLEELRRATRQGQACVVQLMNYRKNGDAFVNYLSVTPIHDSAGVLTHYVGIQSDITDLVNHKKAELAAKHAAVQAAAAVEAKSQFLARMSHEIRTPLNGMIAVGQLLAETALSPAQWDLVSTIRCSGETLLTLISDILDFSRIEANKMVLSTAPFRLSSVIEAAMEIAGLAAGMKRLQVAYHIAEGVPRVMLGDAQRLQQILLNVLNNAVKFTEQGAILLEVWSEPVPELQGCEASLQKAGEQSAAASERQPTAASSSASDSVAEVVAREEGNGEAREREQEGMVSRSEARTDASVGGSMHGSEALSLSDWSSHVPTPADDPGTCGEGAALDYQGASRDLGAVLDAAETQSRPAEAAAAAGIATLQGLDAAPAPAGEAAAAAQLPEPQSAQIPARGSAAGAADPKEAAAAAKAAFNLPTLQRLRDIAIPAAGAHGRPDEHGADFANPQTISGAAVVVDHLRADAHSSDAALPRGISGATPAIEAATKEAVARADGQETMIHFSVRDTGIGISKEDLGLLFQSFSQVDASQTRRYGGSGLGLAISQKLAEAMGGQMWAESHGLGMGSCFRWTIACRLPPPAAAARPQPAPTAAQRGLALPPKVPVAPEDALECNNPCAEMNAAPPDAVDYQGSTSMQRLNRSLWCEGSGSSTAMPGPAAPSSSGRSDTDLEEQTLRMTSGKKVLLVEPCDMVRQVLMLALRAWGISVCAVKSEEEAISHLNLRSNFVRKPAAATRQQTAQEAMGDGKHMQLQHAGDVGSQECQISGPFDVVLMDMTLSHLLHALLQGEKSEAARVIFLGWPGQHELDDEEGPHTPPGGREASLDGLQLPPLIAKAAVTTAQPPLALNADCVRAQNGRQLGYVVVTRPARQGRLKLALEEVLSMQVDTPLSSRSGSEATIRDVLGRPTSEDNGSRSSPFKPAQLLAMPRQHPQHERPSIDLSGEGIQRVASGGQLKAAAPVKNKGRRPAESGEARAAQIRVLIAEDNMINMKVALGILNRMGYKQVTKAMDGQEAYEEIVKHGGPDAFDVILMDLHMPRKGGMEVVSEVRKQWPRTRVRIIAVTADAFEDTREKCLASGFNGWLAKPFRIEDLASVMDAIPQRPA
ncbi:probable sensor histidine kinase GacS [Coccomyxa sp. Obi]|nr:probable sensor histidine kinase GacS [Coccomyxa sp. Obi]